MENALTLYALGAAAVAVSLPKIKTRLELSKAKHPSLAGHSKMARRFARLVPFYEYDEERFFSVDDAPDEIAARRTRRLHAAGRTVSANATPRPWH